MNGKNGSVNFLGLLQVAFIVMKLMDYIGWSWWAVLIPFWVALVYSLLASAVKTLSKLGSEDEN